MLWRIVLFSLNTLLVSCTGSDTKPQQQERPPQTQPPLTSMEVRDKTPPPSQRAAVPAAFANIGWGKTIDTAPAAIPANIPAANTAYYTAEKNISGRKREISVVFGDLLKESDAIVNAANSGLEGGGGIDGIIHNAALVNGKDLLAEEAKAYKKLHNISSFVVGSAMAMNPYGLGPKITMIIATVGPQGPTSDAQKELELYSAVYNSMLKANEYGAKSISFPGVSIGIFQFPIDTAADLYQKAALKYFEENPTTGIDSVRFVMNSKKNMSKIGQGFKRAFP